MMDPRIPTSSSAWQLWHSDLFDRDSPASVEASGTNIVEGLYQLWLHTLKEAIQDHGTASFSRFHLTWGDTAAARAEVAVDPFDNRALLQLRRWANLMSHQQGEDSQASGEPVLSRLAQLHYELLQESSRWTASAIDWDAEARELLARVERLSGPEAL